jgi:hypothetical protein
LSILSKEHLDPKAVSRLLADDGTLATPLQVIALTVYGPEIYEVDPMEIVLRLEEDFHVKLTETIENKLKSILLATSTDIFYEDPQAFTSICNTLINGDPGLDNFDPLTIPEVLWGIYEVELNHGPHEVHPGVQSLIGSVLEEEMTDSEGGPVESDPYQYAWDFMNELHSRLRRQLGDLGVPEGLLPPIKTPEMLAQEQVQ